MNLPAVKFNTTDQPEFFKELRKRVNEHFDNTKSSKYANWNMKLKTVFMLMLYFVPLLLLVLGMANSLGVFFGIWVLMGLGMSGIGLSIMHDANHGAYSRNEKVNNILGFLLNFLGGYHLNWRIQHNKMHHTYTNVEGYDEDIQNRFLRFSPATPQKKIFRYQAYYAPFLYSLMTIYWLVSKDFERIKRYERLDMLQAQGVNYPQALRANLFHKTWYVLLTIVLPIVASGFAWWQVLLGFMLMQMICGVLLALIFQPAHVVNETKFYQPVAEGSLENNWAIHQLRTTANFANKARVFSWFVGGLNYQIEHHLFPHICHVHYHEISKIVQATASEYGITYHQHGTFWQALKSHFTVLDRLGKGTYSA